MRNFKKVAAIGLAATMLMGSMATAFAAEGGASGSGNYEGYVEETSVFSVDVPTDASATQGFDFFVDPNGLLAATNYARMTGATADDFEADATLFFTRTPVAEDTVNNVAEVVKYGKDSESITFTNKSSYAVNVEVSAAVTGVDGITLGAVEDDTTAPTIYLALVAPGADGNNATTPITASGAAVTGSIDGENSNFEIVYEAADADAGTEAGYRYVERTATDDAPLAPWNTYSFNLTGECGGTWTADQAEAEPTVTLTWKVTDPEATSAATACKLQTVASGVGTDITTSITADKGIYIKVDNALLTTSSDKLTSVSINDTALTITTKGNSSGNGGAVYFKLPSGTTLSSGDVFTVVLDGTTYTFTVA